MVAYTVAAKDDDLVRGQARLGAAEVVVCTDGTCRFDGGAMFGMVPKALWQRRMEADAQNRVMLGLNCVVVRLGGATVLIETGFGNKIAPKMKEIYAMEERLPASLGAAGLRPEDVNFVINTHLHWDHCGWNTLLSDNESLRAMFINAEYVVPAGEVEHGRMQLERDAVSYVPENYEPLVASGQMRMAAAPKETVCAGIWMERFPGHTASMMAVHVESEGEHACFISDLVPTSAHLDLTWGMAFDLDPLRVIEERRRFFARALEEHWLVLFSHDHRKPMTHLDRDARGRIVCQEMQGS